jgi:uncharacterized membrane protein
MNPNDSDNISKNESPLPAQQTNRNHPNSSEALFLSALKLHLQALKVNQVEDILGDYREHFAHGKAKGKTEEQICSDLGSPITIAKAYEAENLIREVKNTKHSLQWTVVFKVLGRIVVLAPINFFMLLIPGIILASMVFAGWAASFGLATAAFVALGVLVKASIFSLNAWAGLSFLSACLGLFGLAMIAGMMVFIFSKFILMSLISYLQWNLNFILEK